MIKIKPDHKNRKVLLDIEAATSKHQRGIKAGLHEAGQENRRFTRKMIRTGKRTGRLYPFRGGWHQASAPGEPPANMTGKLAKSIGFKVIAWHSMEFGARAPYAKFLEDGTRKMAARPYLKVTVDKKARDTVTSIEAAVDRELKR